MSRIRVGVLRGGPSSEYEVSLRTGASVLKNLPEEIYEGIEVFIDRQGVWHIKGKPYDPGRVVSQIDVAFNAMHGEYGEDGTVQRILESFGAPYTGSNSFASAVAMNKPRTREIVERAGVRVARGVVLGVTDDLDEKVFELFRTFPQPSVIKPATCGSSVGVAIAKNFDDFGQAIRHAFTFSAKILIEQYIPGTEATVGVIDHFRGHDVHALLPIEIIPPLTQPFFSYDAKYSGNSQEICPGNFPREIKEALEKTARLVHQSLGLRHYSRSDFIVSPRGIYFLEVNTLPGLTEHSLLPKALAAGGTPFPLFLDHLIKLALQRR
jgi:D-alanine-D-alanine ligase